MWGIGSCVTKKLIVYRADQVVHCSFTFLETPTSQLLDPPLFTSLLLLSKLLESLERVILLSHFTVILMRMCIICWFEPLNMFSICDIVSSVTPANTVMVKEQKPKPLIHTHTFTHHFIFSFCSHYQSTSTEPNLTLNFISALPSCSKVKVDFPTVQSDVRLRSFISTGS